MRDAFLVMCSYVRVFARFCQDYSTHGPPFLVLDVLVSVDALATQCGDVFQRPRQCFWGSRYDRSSEGEAEARGRAKRGGALMPRMDGSPGNECDSAAESATRLDGSDSALLHWRKIRCAVRAVVHVCRRHYSSSRSYYKVRLRQET